MSIVVILVSIVLVSNYVDVVSGSFLLRTQLTVGGVLNSILGVEIIYEGPKVEAMYVIERSDQTKTVDNARKKIEKQNLKKGSYQWATSNSVHKLNKCKILAMLILLFKKMKFSFFPHLYRSFEIIAYRKNIYDKCICDVF